MDEELVDDFLEGAKLRAAGRLLSSCGAMTAMCDVKRKESERRERDSVYANRLLYVVYDSFRKRARMYIAQR